MRRIYGYIRIRFSGQDADDQIITLREMQVPEKDIFIDRQEGSDSRHAEYERLLGRLKADDMLYIRSLDDLGEDYREIGQSWRILTKEKRVDVAVLDMPQLDTRRGRTQYDTLVADIVRSRLEYAPRAERAERRQKQREGITRAKQRGVRFGRPSLPVPENFPQVYQIWRRKEISGEQAAQLCHMSKANFYKKARERRMLEERDVP